MIPKLSEIADKLDQCERTVTGNAPGHEGYKVITLSDRIALDLANWLRAWQIILDMRESKGKP